MTNRNHHNREAENWPPISPMKSLSLVELSYFRTELCKLKANGGYCYEGERCSLSHCLSWHRRNPFTVSYRSLLCPNTRFWTNESQKMKVKTWCRRGRKCLFSHTKEEQMYHPMIYKTQICRDYPKCQKPYCPFAHGLAELREPELSTIAILEGPEIVDDSVRQFIVEDRVKLDFEKKAKEKESILKSIDSSAAKLRNFEMPFKIHIVSADDQDACYTAHINSTASTNDVFDEMFIRKAHKDPPCFDHEVPHCIELLPDGLVAFCLK